MADHLWSHQYTTKSTQKYSRQCMYLEPKGLSIFMLVLLAILQNLFIFLVYAQIPYFNTLKGVNCLKFWLHFHSSIGRADNNAKRQILFDTTCYEENEKSSLMVLKKITELIKRLDLLSFYLHFSVSLMTVCALPLVHWSVKL